MPSRKTASFGKTAFLVGVAAAFLLSTTQAQVTQVIAPGNALDLKAIQDAVKQKAAAQESAVKQDETESSKKTTLEGELRYSRAKLAAAQKRLEVQNAVNNYEEAEKAQMEIKDWQGRIKDTEAQLNDFLAQNKPAGTAGAPQVDSDVILPGENLDIYVVEDPSFNGHYQVRRGGYIIIPQVGRVFVAGKTITAAEALIKTTLETNQLQHGTVMVEKIAGSDVTSGPTIYLAGEFKDPRPFKIEEGTAQTLVSVILSAGGLTDKADLTHVRVERVASNHGVVEEVDVQRILDGGGLASDLQLSNGDVVIIPTSAQHVVYLTGNVKRQGFVPVRPNDHLSVYSAILQNGGFARFANLKRVCILRATEDGSKVRIPVNILAIQKGLQADVPLAPNDIVIVPEKFFSF